MKYTLKHTTRTGLAAVRAAVVILIMLMCFACLMPFDTNSAVYAASAEASGKINADGGAYLRKHTSTKSAKVKMLSNNSDVTIIREVFSSKSTKATKRWYYVSASGKKGYIRSDLVKGISYANIPAVTTAKVNYRKGPSTSMKKKGSLKKGSSILVLSEAKLKGSSKKWYLADVGGKSYYISSKYVKFGGSGSSKASVAAASGSSKSSSSTAATSITVSDQRVPSCIECGKGFTIRGKIKSSGTITSVTIGAVNSGGGWAFSKTYPVNAKSFDIYSVDKDIAFGKLPAGNYTYRVDATTAGGTQTVISSPFQITTNALVAGLLGNPTDGGKARYVYTFDTTNCVKLFEITGFSNAIVPQGMAFTGSEYYILYGMDAMQAIVTYSASGQKINSGGFSFNIGHPNGITWDPKTGLCYIFKGNQKKIYTWSPAANQYGTSQTPYSSSGVAYDSSTDCIYATSQTGVRVYSSEGSFTHRQLFKRCSHGITHYIQDCGAGGGFIFHGISGSNKQTTNFLDIYRAADGKYLGSVRIAIGEIESAVVGNDGYLQILVNTPGKTDYVWKTPLNVNDLR